VLLTVRIDPPPFVGQELGRREEARAAELRALGLTSNRAERALLERRLGPAVSPGGGA
jgi:predicted RNA polymerase sigma factor